MAVIDGQVYLNCEVRTFRTFFYFILGITNAKITCETFFSEHVVKSNFFNTMSNVPKTTDILIH